MTDTTLCPLPLTREAGMTFAEALAFAVQAHSGQVYTTADGPEPYVLHPIRVALAVSPDCQVVALLHDVFEDTDAAPPAGLSETERTALMLLTRVEGETYAHYIEAIAAAQSDAGAIARMVKVADLRENLSHIRPGHRESLRPRYVRALSVLSHPSPEREP